MSAIAVYGVMLAGWSSGSKYPLLGSVRASAQMISYEAALGLTIVMVVLVTGSLSTRAIVDSQSTNFWDWNVIRLGFVPFFLFFIAITAELTRPPFDLTEAESELVGGFHTEYSSIRFALFFLAEFMNVDHHVGHRRHPLLRRPRRAGAAHPDLQHLVPDPVVPGQGDGLPLHLRLAPGGPARACATTS